MLYVQRKNILYAADRYEKIKQQIFDKSEIYDV